MAVTKKQLANLKRGGLTAEEAPRMGSKGGKKSVEVRRQRKAMRETLLELLQLPAESRPEKNNEEVGLLAMLERWHKGDVSAGVFIRDTIGEKPVDKVDARSGDGSMSPKPLFDFSKMTPKQIAELVELTEESAERLYHE